MEEIVGRIGDNEDFYLDGGDPDVPCVLYSTEMQSAEEPELFDISSFAQGLRVTVSCQTYSNEAAWGVTDVTVIYDG
jgi:hypothetical protein